MKKNLLTNTSSSFCPHLPRYHRRNIRRDRGEWSPTFKLGDQQCIGLPNFLAIVFKNQEISRPREPTNKHSSHQNAGFSIWVFKNFPGVIPPDPHSERGRPIPAPNTQPGVWPGAGRKRPGVGTQTLVPLNFSVVVAPLPAAFYHGPHLLSAKTPLTENSSFLLD